MTASAQDLCFVGSSSISMQLSHEIEMAARSDAKVLITGETGVGKDVVARLIHRNSARSHSPLSTINCAGLPDSLLESELFGHVRGSFTGAFRDKPGLLEVADRGTAFLDEAGEMSTRMQGMLLRFLETGEVQRVGSERTARHVNVRVIAATNRDLVQQIGAGAFSRRPVLPAERHSHPCGSAARAPGRHPGAVRVLLRALRSRSVGEEAGMDNHPHAAVV